MDQHDQRIPQRPLLLNFVRPQPADDLDYSYDSAQRLNVTVKDGVPVVATALGRAKLKSVGEVAED